jgi:hypothetical protein
MAKTRKLTLVRFTLFAAFEGDADLYLDSMGDRLAEQLRSENGVVTVASEYHSAAATLADDDDAIIEALEKKRWR